MSLLPMKIVSEHSHWGWAQAWKAWFGSGFINWAAPKLKHEPKYPTQTKLLWTTSGWHQVLPLACLMLHGNIYIPHFQVVSGMAPNTAALPGSDKNTLGIRSRHFQVMRACWEQYLMPSVSGTMYGEPPNPSQEKLGFYTGGIMVHKLWGFTFAFSSVPLHNTHHLSLKPPL